MGFINVNERTINAKLVYYGVGVGGKTTSLQQVHGIFSPRNEVKLVSISTEEDSTLMFDFLPINLGTIGGFKIRIQGYTVPGQPKYRRMRKLVLQGADAVVFVVDSQQSRLQENLEALQSMREHLRTSSGTSEDIPIVMQYNKRDLPAILSEPELDRRFRFRDDIEAFPSVATEGHGVFEAFVHAAGQLIESKVMQYGLEVDHEQARSIAEEARTRLWQVCDEVRRARAVVPVQALPQTKLEVADDDPSWPAGNLLDELRPNGAKGRVDPTFDEDLPLDYELRDTSGAVAPLQNPAEVLSDADLDIDLDSVVLDYKAAAAAPGDEPVAEELEGDRAMLERSVRANLELAERYGELDEARLSYERKVHEMADCTQRAVHDLKRPLSALSVMLKLVERGTLGEVPAKVHDAVQTGIEAVEVMAKLVQDLLDSSQLDHDGMRLDFRACDLDAVVRGVVSTLRFEIEAAGADIEIADLPTMQADPWGMTKVFLNLIGNAVAYLDPARAPRIRVRGTDADADWLVEVEDNGIGIPEDDRARLFKRFERGSNTTGISGSGLGLHIVREIVQGHGGTVAFESAVGAGTTFRIRLPKVPVLAPHSPIADATVDR
ncbi:MAG: ATP-binding protein [Planctomycetota bacterium]